MNVLLRVTEVTYLAIKVLSSEARNSADLLCIEGPHMTTSLLVVFCLELFNSFADIRLGWGTMEILEGSIKVALVMTFLETGNNGAETSLSASNRTARIN